MKDPKRIKPKLHWPTTSWKTRLALLVAGLLIGGSIIFAVVTDRWVVAFVSIIVGYALSVPLWTRNLDPEARRMSILVPLPIVLGFALSFYPLAGRNIPFVIGVILSSALVLWYHVLRHPPKFRAAVRRFRAGDVAQTRELLEPSIEHNPTHWQSFQLRSVANLALFRIREAEQDARAALRLNSTHHACHSALGNALLVQGRYADAKAAFSRALELAPNYAINHHNQGLACFRLEEFREAAGFFRVAGRRKLPFVELRLLASYYLGHSLLQIGESAKAQSAFRSMRRFHQGYEKMLALYQDAPDYPGVAQLRKDLQKIKTYLDG